MLALIRGKILEMIAELQTTIQTLALAHGLVEQNEASQITAHENLSEGGVNWDVSGLPAEKGGPVLEMIERIESRLRPGPERLIGIMVPTHRNPAKGLFGLTQRRKFSRRHDDVILKYVANVHGGWTLLPRATGAWRTGVDECQIEGMRLLLFTAKTTMEADIIADLICIHYDQEVVMKIAWGYGVEFRKRWGMIPYFTNVLLPKKQR
jgi:hypothetical protein